MPGPLRRWNRPVPERTHHWVNYQPRLGVSFSRGKEGLPRVSRRSIAPCSSERRLTGVLGEIGSRTRNAQFVRMLEGNIAALNIT
jgi:hypothetical protein